MDVNQQAVEQSLQSMNLLIHGHTHRPHIHNENGKSRIVLGDWREHEAQILEIDPEQVDQTLELKTWTY